ncbi:hypothetical protein [Variovorax boronicumulans]|uniref:hypothetical protein n=1 Tax=Variovorax boronicumulans TaxID=436515 RepID=UPI003397DA1C
MPVEIFRKNLNAAKLRGLDAQSRFVFASAGHVFNELLLLQKLVHVSRLPPNIEGPAMDSSVGVAMFMLRTLVGKTYEAILLLRKQTIATPLRDQYFASVAGLSERWDEVLDAADNQPWMSVVRNQGAFHYPNANQMAPFLTDAFCEDAYVLIGQRYGDTYFHWAEMAASLPALSAVNPTDPMAGLARMIDDIGELLGRLTDCLALGLTAYIGQYLANDHEGLVNPVQVEAPDFETFHLPYFFADPRHPAAG